MNRVETKHASAFTPDYKPSSNFQSEPLQSQVSSANSMIDDLISDYQGHEKADQGYVRLTNIDNFVREVFDGLGPSKLTNSESDLLSELVRRLNEDSVLQEIRETHTDERLSGESVCLLPSINAQQMSALPGNPTSAKKTAKLGHSRSNLSFMKPKESADEMPLQQEDYHSPPRVRAEQEQIDLQEIERLEEIKQKTIQKLDTEIREIVNQSLTRLDSHRGGDTERAHKEILKNAQEERKKHVDYLFAQMKDEYDRHRIEFSHKYYLEINELSKSNVCSEQSAYIAQKMSENQLLMEDVDYNYQEVLKIITELDDENGYEIEKAKKNTVIKYKNLPGGGISLKLESIVDVPLFNLLALNYEAEGYAKWTPFCKESKLIKRMTKASNAMWMKWEMPPPVSAREGYLIGSGYDRLDINGSILMIAKTIHKDPRAALRYEIDMPAKSKYVRMEIPYIGTDLVPISKTQTKMRLVTTFDPQIRFVPLSLSSWIARKGSIYLLETIVKYAGSLEGEVWKGYLEKSREFYDWLKNVLDAHEANKALNA